MHLVHSADLNAYVLDTGGGKGFWNRSHVNVNQSTYLNLHKLI